MNGLRKWLAEVPTPLAGLALGLASLGTSWENTLLLHGYGQWFSAMVAAGMLVLVAAKYLVLPHLFVKDLKDPVIGGVLPTFAMSTMAISAAVGLQWPDIARVLWLFAVPLHMILLCLFAFQRLKNFRMEHMVPTWFIPPIGIIMAPLTCPAPDLLPLARGIFYFGMVACTILLPLMLYRLIFHEPVAQAARPTLAILAAPPSVVLAGYVSVVVHPDPLIVDMLLGSCILMTLLIYVAMFKLLRLPFSPGFASFTFPMAAGATALYKVVMSGPGLGFDASSLNQLTWMGKVELDVASVVIGYVVLRYMMHYLWPRSRRESAGAGSVQSVPAVG